MSEAETHPPLTLSQALISIRHNVFRLHELLQLDVGIDLEAFQKVINSKLVVQVDPDYPLMIGITGGGSAGKSSLFNAMVGSDLSVVKARAGLTRRVFAAIHPKVLDRDGFLGSLFEAFGSEPEPMNSPEDLTTPGVPQFVSCEAVPPNLVLLDTPDFDVGDRRDFTNRAIAKPVLEACDVFLYIFTNATYANRENTHFIRETLTNVGLRKAILVYRCSRAIAEAEVREHMETVASNLYGQDSQGCIVGRYRVNEDDEVASGKTLMGIDPLPECPPLIEKLRSLDPASTRAEFIAIALRDICGDAGRTLEAGKRARLGLEVYRDAVRIAASWATTSALRSFPRTELMGRFLEIWEETQPRPLKILKGVGKVTGLPVKGALWAGRKVRELFWKEAPPGRHPRSRRNPETESLGSRQRAPKLPPGQGPGCGDKRRRCGCP